MMGVGPPRRSRLNAKVIDDLVVEEPELAPRRLPIRSGRGPFQLCVSSGEGLTYADGSGDFTYPCKPPSRLRQPVAPNRRHRVTVKFKSCCYQSQL
jgi:hypothetical protein